MRLLEPAEEPTLELGARNPDGSTAGAEAHAWDLAGCDLAVDGRRMLPELVRDVSHPHQGFAFVSLSEHKHSLVFGAEDVAALTLPWWPIRAWERPLS
jgi:hypothetical protein